MGVFDFLKPEKGYVPYSEALRFHSEGNLNSSYEKINQALEENQELLDAYLLKGEICAILHKFDEAYSCFSKYYSSKNPNKISKNDKIGWIVMAYVCSKIASMNNDIQYKNAAFQYLDKIKIQDKNFLTSYLNNCCSHYNVFETRDREKQFLYDYDIFDVNVYFEIKNLEGTSNIESDYLANSKMGYALFKLGKFDDALVFINESILLHDQLGRISIFQESNFLKKGEILLKQNKYEEAISALDECLLLNGMNSYAADLKKEAFKKIGK